MAYSSVVFIETQVFAKQIVDLLEDEDYRILQRDFGSQPRSGGCHPGQRWFEKGAVALFITG